MYDLIIIGSGPIGLAAGIEARRRQLNFLILEKGCLVNSIYHYPTNMTFFSTSEKIEIGGIPFVSHGTKPTRREALEYYRRVAGHFDLPIHTYEPVSGFEKLAAGYRVNTSRDQYHTQHLVIATGFYDHPNLMNVPGEELPKVKHYYDDPHPYVGRHVIVVGAANSAIDVALETWRAGAKVNLVHHGPTISHRVKYWVKPDIDNRIAEGSIPAYFDSKILEIRAREVDLTTPNGAITLPNDFVLAMTGYQPDFSWLTRNGIELCDDEAKFPVRNESTFESNLPNVFLAGTVCGGMNTNKWFIENSIAHATVVIKEIAARLSVTST